MAHRHATLPMHPVARTWHIKRRLREQGRMSHEAWRQWAEEYINAMPDTPWRTFCIQQVHRITGDHIKLSIARSRRDLLDQTVEALASVGKPVFTEET